MKFFEHTTFFSDDGSYLLTEWFYRISIVYMSFVGILGVYKNFKKAEKNFEEYSIQVVVSMFKTSIIYGLLAIGLLLISLAFIVLLLPKKDYDLIFRIEMLLYGMFYVPRLLYAFCDNEIEIGKFSKVVIKYVLGSLVMAAFLIIYAYIIKIAILRDMPKNVVFRIIAGLFVLGLPIWTMIQSFKDKDLYGKVCDYLPIFFMPFIFLQIYCIGVRISAYGITPSRYMCIVLIILEVCYFLIYVLKRNKIEYTMLVVFALICICTVFPKINVISASRNSQEKILMMIKNPNASDKEISKAIGAYEYFSHDDNYGKRLISEKLNQEDLKKLKKTDNKNISTTNNIYVSSEIKSIYIDGYKQMYMVSTPSRYDIPISDEEEALDLREVLFTTKSYYDEDNKYQFEYKADLSKYVEDIINIDIAGNSTNSYFNDHKEYVLDDSTKIVFEYMSVEYDIFSHDVLSYNFRAVILKK